MKEKHRKKPKNSPLKRTSTKGFALTSKDLENIKLIKNRLLAEKIYLTDSAIVRMALELTATATKDCLLKVSHQIEKIPLGRPKGS